MKLLSLLILFFPTMSFAAYTATNSSGLLTVTGYVTNSGVPVAADTATATVTISASDGTNNCNVYSENLSGIIITNGDFSLSLGSSGTGTLPGGYTKLSQVLDATATAIAASGCSSGAPPINGTIAHWQVNISNLIGGLGTYVAATPLVVPLSSVPQSQVASSSNALQNFPVNMITTAPVSGNIMMFNASGQWVPSTPAGAGLLTSITGGTGITVAGSTVSLTTPVSVANGGTGIGGGTSGGLPYFNGAASLASSGMLALDGIVVGGGVGGAPSTLGLGTSGQILTSNGVGVPPSWQTLAAGTVTSVTGGTGINMTGTAAAPIVNLASPVAVTNGGTGLASTTINQIVYSSAANTLSGLPTAASGVLVTNAAGAPSISASLPFAVQSNITNTGTVTAGTWNGTAVGVPYGGTGLNSGTSGGVPYFNAANTMASSGVLAAGQVMVGGGAGVAPSTIAAGGAGQVLTMSGGNPIWQSPGAAPSVALSGITSAGSPNSITNGAFAQTWQWQLAANNSAMSFKESAASTGGTGSQNIVNIQTLAASTANPLYVSAQGGNSFVVSSNGNVGVGTSAPAALLDLSSTTSGFLMPRMSAAQRTAMAGPATGLEVYDTSAQQIYYYNGTSWQALGVAGAGVTSITAGAGLTGGTITTSGTIGLGTELAGLNGLSTIGFVQRTGAGTYSTSSQINLTSNVTGVLPVSNGGTNSSVGLAGNRMMISSGGAIVEAPPMTNGQIVVGSAGLPPQVVSPLGDWTISNTGVSTVAKVNGVSFPTAPAVNTVPVVTAANLVTYEAVPVAAGGTGTTSFSMNSAIAANAAGNLTSLAGGSNGSLLQETAGGPSWTTATFPSIVPVNSLLYASSPNVVSTLNPGGNGQLLTMVAGVPTWSPAGAASSVALSGLTSAIGSNTITNSNWPVLWDWQLTANTNAFSVSENAASTGGTGTQNLVNISTLAASTANPLRVTAQGNPAILVTSSGNVGIGALTTGPNSILDVRSASPAPMASAIHFASSNTGSTYNVGGYLTSTSTGQALVSGGVNYNGASWISRNSVGGTESGPTNMGAIFGSNGGSDFIVQFAQASTYGAVPTINPPVFKIDGTTGNVGVGTTSPTSILHVNGAGGPTTSTLQVNGGSGVVNPSNTFSAVMSSSNTALGNDWNTISAINTNTTINNMAVMGFADSVGGSNAAAVVGLFMDHSPSANGQLLFMTRGGGSSSERMRITNVGNVGIGTTNPNASLDVAGGLRAGNSASVLSCSPGVGGTEGTQRYNYGTHMMEYCNGASWVSTYPPPSTRTIYSTAGGGSYTPPAGVRQIKVRMVGGGGGGAGTSTGVPTAGTAGAQSSFAGYTAVGGPGATGTGATGGPGTGGVNNVGALAPVLRIPGGAGNYYSGSGGSNPIAQGPNATFTVSTAGISATIGGAGGGSSAYTSTFFSGGSSGEYVELTFNNPGTFAYAVGAAGAGGGGTYPGGSGAPGIIIIDEYY